MPRTNHSRARRGSGAVAAPPRHNRGGLAQALSSVRIRLMGAVFLLVTPAALLLYLLNLRLGEFTIGLLALVAAWIGGGAVESLLYGVTGRDLPTLLGVGATLTGVALLALVGPALRASRTDPILVLSAQ